MKTKCKQSGISLTEMIVVVAIIAMLAVFGLPAIDTLFDSMGSTGSTKAMISAALSTARAIAAKEQRYAGIRFQVYTPDNSSNVAGSSQYMIFIIQDEEATGLAWGFRGLKPMKLPGTTGVMDLRIRTNLEKPSDKPIEGLTAAESNINIDQLWELRDTTTFSIIFSPSGKLVIHDVRVWNRNGNYDDGSKDDIFNTKSNVEVGKIAMFYQDNYADMGLGQEPSRNSFVIYDRNQLLRVSTNRRWSDYLSKLDKIYINPYTGTIISGD